VYEAKGSRCEQDAGEWLKRRFKTSQEMYFDYCLEVGDWNFVLTKEITGLLRRYKFMKMYGFKNYDNDYDRTPATWIDAVETMDTEYKLAYECKNGNKKS